MISGSKQNIEHGYDQIYDMFDLSRILRIREISGLSFHHNSFNNNDKQRGGDLKQRATVSDGRFDSSSTGTFMPQVLFRWGEERVFHIRQGTIASFILDDH